MAANPQELLSRYHRLLSKRSTWDTRWQDLADYLLPHKSNIITRRTPGSSQTTKVFDSTGIHAAEVLAARLHGLLLGQSLRLSGLKLRDKEIQDQDDVRKWLDTVAEGMFMAFAQSNLQAIGHEVMTEIIAFGTGGMLVEEREPQRPGFNGLNFHAMPVGSFCIEEDAEGHVDTIFRCLSLTARAAVQKWGAPKVSEKVRENATKNPDREYTFIQAIYPRTAVGNQRALRLGRARAVRPDRRPWASCIVERDAKKLVQEKGYDEFPAMVVRWSKTPGEVYGRGPGHSAIPDVKTLNKAVENFLVQWALAIRPPGKIRHGGVIGAVQWVPGQWTVVRAMEDMQEFVTNARFDVAAAGIKDLREQIKDTFFTSQLSLKDTPQMTALEVQVRWELMQQVLGPTLGRLMDELLNRLVDRAFGLMLRAGAFPPVPEALAAYAAQQGEFDVEYEGPLARAQRSPELAGIERTYALGAPIAGVYPAVWDNMDHDKAFRRGAELNGLTPDLLRSEDEVAQQRQARQQQMEVTQALGAGGALAEAAGKVAPFLKAIRPPPAPVAVAETAGVAA